ncbi:PD-(D/E)XK motif protein [Rufibacter aurantiacus]|uniref:PD-(D/E)XK motif protein n=1 Tax=Rufibacter aurantiacus TaxID=2817374 RepID=UPI001B3061E8|nr:PD-(D/E)XK motif protein [Rufibacter aurantiacus]
MDLKNRWDKLEPAGSEVFRQIRFPGECYAELYLALDAENQRCLVLYLPQNLHENYAGFRPKPHANLSIAFSYFEHGAGLIIKLKNAQMAELFDDLILSLFKRIAAIQDEKEYTSKLISTYWDWGSFFEKSSTTDLSQAEIKGLAGELVFLQSLLQNTTINKEEVLQSWCGVYGDDKDFILKDHVFEIKAISSSGHEVKISSEYQLEPVSEKKLYLVVIELNTADPTDQKSFSLREKYLEIKLHIIKSGVELHSLVKALAEKGVNEQMLEKYEHYRFAFCGMRCYEADHEEFPVLIKSRIKEGIKNLSYNIELGKIARFVRELEYRNI